MLETSITKLEIHNIKNKYFLCFLKKNFYMLDNVINKTP